MSKFKAGDTVVCKDASGFDMSHLEVGHSYVVEYCDGVNIELVGVDYSTKVWRFEPFEEWASHQKRVSVKDELALTKIQVASLQELKRSQAALLKELSQAILDTFEHDNSWRNWYCLHCNESHKRSIGPGGFDKWEDVHRQNCVVLKARKYLEENY